LRFSPAVLRALPYATPALLILLFDLARRREILAGFGLREGFSYGLTLLQGIMLWGSALMVGARRGAVGRVVTVLAVLMGTFLLGGQRYFFQLYSTYLNRDAVFFGTTFGDSVRRLLLTDLRGFLGAHGAPLVAALGLAVAARWLPQVSISQERAARWILGPSVLGALFLPCSFRGMQASTPDRLYLHALGGLVEAKLGRATSSEHTLPGARSPEFLPALVAAPSRPRNLVFLLTESVRADVVCTAYRADCAETPFSNEAARGRMPLRQLRANDSSTTISVAVTLTGVAPTATREEMHRAPTLWEYARAAGYDTAYWTSQDLRGIHSDMFVREVGARIQVQGHELDPGCDGDVGADDRLLARRVAREIRSLKEPFVAVVHLANTHFPYLVDEGRQPFQPSENTKDPAKNSHFFNYYRNAVYRQDEAVAATIQALRDAPGGERTVLVFTSDHGEAFREHHQLAHSLSVYDEEIHVPGWIDAPPGALTQQERASLERLADTPVWHLDLLPTFLDLLGLHDAPELRRFRARMPGASLLRALPAERVVPLTNCTAVWGCPFRNWGLMRGPWKLEARAWDPDWHCWNVLDDPKEQRELGAARCGDLAREALGLFGEKPGGK
jgi:arylsulfatase A-like enzyme